MTRLTRIASLLLIGCLAGVVILLRNPIHSKLLNLAFLFCIFGSWATLSFLLWRKKIARIAMATIPVLAAIPFLLPGDWINPMELRDDYLKRLNQFENTPYVWGREGKWIQADPGIGHVATLDGRTADNLWFQSPVTIHRWSFLETKKKPIF